MCVSRPGPKARLFLPFQANDDDDGHSGLPLPSPMNWSFFTPGIVTSLKASLKRMGVESVELFQASPRLPSYSIVADRHRLIRFGWELNRFIAIRPTFRTTRKPSNWPRSSSRVWPSRSVSGKSIQGSNGIGAGVQRMADNGILLNRAAIIAKINCTSHPIRPLSFEAADGYLKVATDSLCFEVIGLR